MNEDIYDYWDTLNMFSVCFLLFYSCSPSQYLHMHLKWWRRQGFLYKHNEFFSYIFSFFYLSFGCFVDYIFFSFPFFTGHTIYIFILLLVTGFLVHTTKQLFLDYDKYDEFKSLSTYLNTNFYAIICIRVVRYILLMGEGN